jgi:hypothetical protein
MGMKRLFQVVNLLLWTSSLSAKQIEGSIFKFVGEGKYLPLDQRAFSGNADVFPVAMIKTFEGDFRNVDATFGTALNNGEEGLFLSCYRDFAVLYPIFDSLSSNNNQGLKMLDFCSRLSNNICFLVSGSQFDENKACFTKCLRQVVSFLAAQSQSEDSKRFITLLLDTHGATREDTFEHVEHFASKLIEQVSIDLNQVYVFNSAPSNLTHRLWPSMLLHLRLIFNIWSQ